MRYNNLNKILLIEDDDNDAELIMSTIEEYELMNSLLRLSDGEEALNYLLIEEETQSANRLMPDLILLDLILPKVSGLEVLRRLKSDKILFTTPVVTLTSSRGQFEINAAYNHGANAYVIKPIDYEQFVETIDSIIKFWAFYNKTPNKE